MFNSKALVRALLLGALVAAGPALVTAGVASAAPLSTHDVVVTGPDGTRITGDTDPHSFMSASAYDRAPLNGTVPGDREVGVTPDGTRITAVLPSDREVGVTPNGTRITGDTDPHSSMSGSTPDGTRITAAVTGDRELGVAPNGTRIN